MGSYCQRLPKENIMTSRQISLVQGSFELVKPIADQAGLLFYDRLFTVDPSLRHMFTRP
jgi:nitric oxide dioxygenase